MSSPSTVYPGLSLAVDSQNCGINATITSNTLVVTLTQANGSAITSSSPVILPFRSSTLANGTISNSVVTSPITLTVPAASTLGFVANTQNYVYVFVFNDAGNLVLGVSGSTIYYDYGLLATPTTISGSSNSGSTYYSSSSVSANSPVIYVGRIKVQTANPNWSTITETSARSATFQGSVLQAAGSDTHIQYNNNGVLAGSSENTYDYNNLRMLLNSRATAGTLSISNGTWNSIISSNNQADGTTLGISSSGTNNLVLCSSITSTGATGNLQITAGSQNSIISTNLNATTGTAGILISSTGNSNTIQSSSSNSTSSSNPGLAITGTGSSNLILASSTGTSTGSISIAASSSSIISSSVTSTGNLQITTGFTSSIIASKVSGTGNLLISNAGGNNIILASANTGSTNKGITNTGNGSFNVLISTLNSEIGGSLDAVRCGIYSGNSNSIIPTGTGTTPADLMILGGQSNTINPSGSGSFSGSPQRNIILGGLTNTIGGNATDTNSYDNIIIAGQSNTISPTGTGSTTPEVRSNTILGGNTNSITPTVGTTTLCNANTIIGGQNNVMAPTGTLQYASIVGGRNNTISVTGADNSVILGGQRGVVRHQSSIVTGAGRFSVDGDAQGATYHLRVQTTNNTATSMTIDGATASSTTRLTLQDNEQWMFYALISCGDTAATDAAGFSIQGSVKRGSGVGTVALVGTPTVTNYLDTNLNTATVAAVADTTNGALRVQVTGITGKTLNWVCRLIVSQLIA
jgi:hypothetical protein